MGERESSFGHLARNEPTVPAPEPGTVSDIPQQHDSLDKSPAQFPSRIVDFSKELSQGRILELRDEDVAWHVEYLDSVVDVLDPVDPAYQKCLNELGWICSAREKLPRSHVLDLESGSLIPDPDTPVGPYESSYTASYNGSKVWVAKLDLSSRTLLWQDKRMFYRNLVKWKHLTHPNILPFLGITLAPLQFISPRISGVKLNEYIITHPRVDRLGLLIGIASGLNYLHSCDVVHGSLGGPRILVDKSGCPRIVHSGEIWLVKKSKSKLRKPFSEYHRCLRWAAPEMNSRGEYNKQTDVFSFAMVMVEAFTGEVPFFPKSDHEAISAVVSGEQPARPGDPNLTEELWALMKHCWNKDPQTRPGVSVVLSTLHGFLSKKTGENGGSVPKSESSQIATRTPTPSEKGSPSDKQAGQPSDRSPEEDSSLREDDADPLADENGAGASPPVLPPAPIDCFSREEVVNEVLDLATQVASVGLFGPVGVGKSSVGLTLLHHDQIKAKFGRNRFFMRFDKLTNSLEGFLGRVSDATHIDVTRLQLRLQSPPPLILLLDGIDSILDPRTPESEEVSAMIEEFGSYEHVCLVTTSRIYPDIHGFHRVEVPTLCENGARDVFYSLCNWDRSSAVDNLIAKLDSHPLSIHLLAGCIRENNLDGTMLLKAWDDDQTSSLKTSYYRKLMDVIEPTLRFPTINKLGPTARDVLEAIATFPSGVEECELERIFHNTAGIGGVVDILCKFSLIYRQDGFVKMPSPFQFYFVESMLVPAQKEETFRWDSDCMPAKAWLPIYTAGPPRPIEDPDIAPPDAIPRVKAPSRRKWIKRLPRFVKKRLLALFGRRVTPTILINIQGDPVNAAPVVPEQQIWPPPVAYDVE